MFNRSRAQPSPAATAPHAGASKEPAHEVHDDSEPIHPSRTINIPIAGKSMTINLPPLPDNLPTSPAALLSLLAPYIRTIKSVPLGPDTPEARARTLSRIRTLTKLLDTQFKIPGVGTRIGIDPFISSVPYVGDLISTALSLYMVYLMRRFHVPWWVAIKMMGNVVLNGAVGVIPGIGAIFDVAYKPNLRNLILLEDYLRKHAVETLKMDPAQVDADIRRARKDIIGDTELPTLEPEDIPSVSASSSSTEPLTSRKGKGIDMRGGKDEMPGAFKLYPDVDETNSAARSAIYEYGGTSTGKDESIYPSAGAPALPPRNTKRR